MSPGTPTGSHTWSSLTSSGDGNKMLAADDNGLLYVSTDQGLSWTPQSPTPGTGAWSSVSVSGDGSTMVAADASGTLWTNSNGTWVAQTYLGSSQPFSATAVSADGQVIVVGTSPGPLFISRDGGNSWTRDASAGSQDWTSLSLSADGSHGLATTSGSSVYSISVGTT